ncbi:MAG: M56 family metallopeptidase [Oscillospiraceae bacterium]|nr:M56 family metallopeptidase [Oscillospiraceae bacterium]
MSQTFDYMLEMSLTGTVIIAAVIVIRFFIKKLPRRFSYYLWIIPAIRLLLPVDIPSAASIFNIADIPTDIPVQTIQTEYAPITNVNDTEYIIQNNSNNTSPEKQPYNITEILPFLWLAGVAVMTVYTLSAYIRTARFLKDSEHSTENIYICRKINTPFVFGISKSRIYLPEGISHEDTVHILAHERVHILRHDSLVKLLGTVVITVHWFNPAVWLAFKLMTEDMEISCDEQALKEYTVLERKAYANALLSIAAKQNNIAIGSMLSFGESGSKTRIKKALAMKKPKAVFGFIGAAVTVTAAVCMLTSADKLVDTDVISADIHLHNTYTDTFTVNTDEKALVKTINSLSLEKASIDEAPSPEDSYIFTIELYYSNDPVEYVSLNFFYSLNNVEYDKDIMNLICVERVKQNKNSGPNTEKAEYYHADAKSMEKLYDTVIPLFESLDPTINYDTPETSYYGTAENVLNANNINSELGSFVISTAENGFEAHSPLTDIYVYFSDENTSFLTLRRKTADDKTEELIIPGSFDPYYTAIRLLDITHDGIDDLFFIKHIRGTGVVDNIAAAVDGSSMTEISIDRYAAEKMLSDISLSLLENENFKEPAPYISPIPYNQDEKLIYPYYPDKSVCRRTGMEYTIETDGILTAEATFHFVGNENFFSKLHKAYFTFEYTNSSFIPVTMEYVLEDGSGTDISEQYIY